MSNTQKRRLDAVKSLVKNGDILCDVGSDHALLPIMLIKSGVIEKAIACDINIGPLESGRKNAVLHRVTGIEFVLSDGLTSVDSHFDVAAICGMGGETVIKIITDAKEKAKCRLILQPMTAIEKVRAFLWQNGYVIDREEFAYEDSKSYCVISAVFTGENTPFSYADTYLGEIRPETELFYKWHKKISDSAKKRILGAKTEKEKKNIASLFLE